MANPLPPEEEERLIALADSEPDALRTLYNHYYPRIFAYVAHRVGRREDAEDIVSEIFVRVVKGLHRFEYRGEGAFAAWLFQIARNETVRFGKRYKRRDGEIGLDEMPDLASESLPPDQILMRKERYVQLRQQIEQLTPRRREIVRLRFFGGLRNQEIAQVLGLDERTVASHLSRAMDDLRRDYQAPDAEGQNDG